MDKTQRIKWFLPLGIALLGIFALVFTSMRTTGPTYLKIDVFEGSTPIMIITNPDGRIEKTPLEKSSINDFNLPHFMLNSSTVTKKLNELSAQGWELSGITSEAFSVVHFQYVMVMR